MQALMERSRPINEWLINGKLCMLLLRNIVKDCLSMGRSSSQSQQEYMAHTEDMVCRKIQMEILMRSTTKTYEER
jgi:hypothetical protein